MGGVYFTEDHAPAVWRQPFSDWIEPAVTFENPKGP
jgi:hypothetical protein